MCYIHNSFSVLLITFYTLLMITLLIIKAVKIVKNLEKIIFVSRSNPDLIKKVVYFFAAFLCVGIRIFVDFFLNKKFVSLLIILLNIILKINRWFSLFASSTSSRVWFSTIFSKRWSNWFDEKMNPLASLMLIIIKTLLYVFNEILMLISLIFLLMQSLFDKIWKLLFPIFLFSLTFSHFFFEGFVRELRESAS